MDLNAREKALLHQCVEHSLTHIEEIEDITDEYIKDELEALKVKLGEVDDLSEMQDEQMPESICGDGTIAK